MSALDDLVAQSQSALPRETDPREDRRVIERAAVGGSARHRAQIVRRLAIVVGVAAALAAATVTGYVLPPQRSGPNAPIALPAAPARPAPAAPTPTPTTDLELPTGDRLRAASGARFAVEEASSTSRRIHLDDGAMLFDVRPIEGSRFEVVTERAIVRVLGTVFTVEASPSGTAVRVYEGRVEVVRMRDPGGEPRVVTAGGELRVGGELLGFDALVAPAREAARSRARPSAPRAPTEEAPDPELAEARRWIAEGRAAHALSAARRASANGRPDPWVMVEGDALRALDRPLEAAEAYHRAAEALPPPRRHQAGYLEAQLRAATDPSGALRALRGADVAAPGSDLRERALILEERLLGRLGRYAERRAVAEAYLREFPEGSRAGAMRAHTLDPEPLF
jgi:hypothetical protein